MSQGTSVMAHFACPTPLAGRFDAVAQTAYSHAMRWVLKFSGSSDIGPAEMITAISALLVCVVALLTPVQVAAQEARPRSILVLDQSDLRGPFYYSVFSGLRSAVSADDRSHNHALCRKPRSQPIPRDKLPGTPATISQGEVSGRSNRRCRQPRGLRPSSWYCVGVLNCGRKSRSSSRW